LIGLDIGSTSLKWVELAPVRGGRFRLERCAVEPVQPGWMVDGRMARFDELAAAVQRLASAAGSPNRRVALAIPDAALMIRPLIMPAGLSQAEQAAKAAAEFSAHSNQALADMVLDYGVHSREETAVSGGNLKAWVAACPKDTVQDRVGLMQAAGLLPVVVEGEAQACARAAQRLVDARPALPAGGMVAVLDMGAAMARLQLIHQGEIVHQAPLDWGGARLTGRISEIYGLAATEAELQKRRGVLPAACAEDVFKPFIAELVESLASELERSASLLANGHIGLVMLAGGAGVLAGLPQAIRSRAGLECFLADPFDGFEAGAATKRVASARSERAGLMTACGLALRRFAAPC
jgi:type IV pilus assembly protein PilM